ncbi:MAG: DUF4292 domain-containing protein [Paludibacteraceae bacterium]|nr:DUF4292 domain-containing protein [Paludibacteraceae bacterium]
MRRNLFNSTSKRRNKGTGEALKDRCAVGLLFIASLFMFGCSSQRVVMTGEQGQRIKDEGERIRTVHVPSARAGLTIDGEYVSARVTFMTTIDSLVIWSIQPMAGIELIRLEATPTDLIVFDKTTMEYVPLTYESLLPYSPIPIAYKDVQDIATGAILPKGQNSTLRAFTIAGHSVILNITYPEIRTNVPVNMNRLPLSRFTYKSIDQVL